MNKRFTKSIFAICTAILLTLFVTACGSSSLFSSPTTAAGYSISGTVSGTVTGNVTLILTGGTDVITDTTDSTGAYTITCVANGTYTLYATIAGNVFSPASKSVTVNGANLTGYDFISSAAGAQTFSGANTISANATYSSITIASGATLTATTGKSLTMTVNGIETPISAGTYTGTVVLTLTENIPVSSTYFRTAIYIEDGIYIAAKSVSAAVPEGTVTDTMAENVHITSVGEDFNGIYVTNSDSSTTPYNYTIDNPVINFTGNGGNDFIGYGAGIVSFGYANLIVNSANIITNGVIRGTICAGGHSTMTVNNSTLRTAFPSLPSTIIGMMSPPAGLGITGTCRSTLVVGNGTVNYNHCTITAEAWGALSTDSVSNVRLNATDSTINVNESGYGSYSIGNCITTFTHCIFNVADQALIMADEAASGVLRDTIVNSGRFGVMAHGGNVGTLTIDQDSVFNTTKTAILVKSASPAINVTDSTFNPVNGIVLQAMVNDDPMATPGGASFTATFTGSTLNGDIVNSMTSKGDINVILDNMTTITGAITTATAVAATPTDAPADEPYWSYGSITNTYIATANSYAVTVALEDGATWIVNQTSYLPAISGKSVLAVDGTSVIKASPGHTVILYVNGVASVTEVAETLTDGTVVSTITGYNSAAGEAIKLLVAAD